MGADVLLRGSVPDEKVDVRLVNRAKILEPLLVTTDRGLMLEVEKSIA